jgi:hypothetical protein
MKRKDSPEEREPSYFDIMPPEMLARLHRFEGQGTFQNFFHYVDRAIKRNVVVPHEEHGRMLKALASIDASYWKITRDEIDRMRDRAFASAMDENFSVMARTNHGFNEFLAARLPSAGRAFEAYKMAYHLVVKMAGTPLLRAQREGDYGGLAELLRSKHHSSREARDYAAKLIEGSAPLRRVRKPPSADTARRHRTIVWWILRARRSGTKLDASYGAAAEEFNCSERWVRKIFSEHGKGEPELLDKANQLIEQLEYFAAFLREHEPK